MNLAVIMIVIIGTQGYIHLEGWSALDSFYMTLITLTTIGFGEIHTLSPNGRLFTIFLILFGLGIFTFTLSAIVKSALSVDFSARRRKRMHEKIKNLDNHAIVCGFGRMGKVICQELSKNGFPFVVIEQRDELIKDLADTNFLWIQGDAADEENLTDARVDRARFVVSMIDNDADGLYLILIARSLNPKIKTIVRANKPDARKRMILAGADKVILPFVMSGIKVAESVLNPAVEDFLDITGVNSDDGERLQLADIYVEADSRLLGKNLTNCGIDRDDLIIVGIKKSDSSFVFAPKADYSFEVGDCLIALGPRQSYNRVIEDLS